MLKSNLKNLLFGLNSLSHRGVGSELGLVPGLGDLGVLLLGGGLLGLLALDGLVLVRLLNRHSHLGSLSGLVGTGDDLVQGVARLQGVLLDGRASHADASGSDDGLDLLGVDDLGEIGVGHGGAGEMISLLVLGRGLEGAEVLSAGLHGRLGPDHHAADVTTGGELQQVQGVDVDNIETGDVSGGLDDTVIVVVDDQRSTGGGVLLATGLALAGADLAVLQDTLEVSLQAESLQHGVDFLGLGHGLDGGVNNERKLRDVLDSVTTGHDERGDSGRSNARRNGMTTLVHIDLTVPLAPDLSGAEHGTTTAHVTEGTLSGTVGTATRGTRNTGNSATSTPRRGGGLVTGVGGDGVGLTGVLLHQLVDEGDLVMTDGGHEDMGHADISLGLGLGVVHRNGGSSGGHFLKYIYYSLQGIWIPLGLLTAARVCRRTQGRWFFYTTFSCTSALAGA